MGIEVKINLLGGFSVQIDNRLISDEVWRSRRTRALVKLLALAPGHRLMREQVLDTLWPNSDFSAASNNLHQTLFQTRKIFQDAGVIALILQDGQLSLADDLSVDVELFETAAAVADKTENPEQYESALALYTGDLLPEDLYEDWTVTRRDSLRLLHLRLLFDLGRCQETRQAYPAAIETHRRVLAIDRANEEAHTALMRLYALTGQRQQALRQYQVLRDALRAELDVEPGPDSGRLFEEIQNGQMAGQAAAPVVESGAGSGPALPSGTVTFLFTDIEGSTPLWERHPEAMPGAVARHHAILQGAIQVHGGVVSKIIGDQFQAAFRLADQAAAAALAAQEALEAEDWPAATGRLRVRMGLHTGPAETSGGDYAVSHTLNRAARVMGAGFGGQILLSRETMDLVSRQLPEGAEILDLGEHRLKGLQILEHLYQLWAPGLPKEFPRLATALGPRHNLPTQLTSFIGRESEITDLSEIVKTNRLVTLTGAGGTGKTRLSLQVAEKVLETFPDGVWLVELAPVSDPALVPQTCTQALELVQQPGASPMTILEHFFENKFSLLILDNCEHVLTACTGLTNTLLKSCLRLHILASSREILSVPGETPFRVPSLSFPDPRSLPALQEMVHFDAVRLFVDRSAATSPEFQLTAKNAAAITQICYRLDGIPLAIELAAARMRVMTVEQLAARLDNAFRILTGGSKAVLPRQQTLHATIDWSYNLLSARERLLLQRLSVFAGGWTLEAAEAVCADEKEGETAIGELDMIDLLAQLVDKSLVIASVQEKGARYHLLETIRQYARNRLMETGDGENVRYHHLAYFAQLSAEAQPHLRAHGMVEWLDRLEQEHDNLRVALEWALASDIELGLKMAADLFWFWHVRGFFDEVVALLEVLLAAESESRGGQALSGQRALQRARGLHALVHHLAYNTNHPLTSKRIEYIQESIAILRGLGPSARHDLAVSIMKLLWIQKKLAQPSALREEMLEIFENENNAFYLSEYYWFQTGSIAIGDRYFDQLAELLEKSLALSKEIGDLDGMMSRSAVLSDLAWMKGDDQRADMLLRDAIQYSRMIKNRWNEPELHLALGKRALARGDYLEAARIARESLSNYRVFNYAIGMNMALGTLLRAAWSQGELEQAAAYGQELLGLQPGQAYDPANFFQKEAEINAFIYMGRTMISQGDIAKAEKLLKITLDSSVIDGRQAHWRLNVELLLAWIALLTQLGDYPRAARLIGVVDVVYQQTRVSYSPRERQEYEEKLDACQAALGEEAYRTAFAAGRGMSLEQAFAWLAGEPG